jgi:hypothetical protein
MTKPDQKGREHLMRSEKLLMKIDEHRDRLYILAQNRRLADPEVVQLSQELDELLNLYNSLITRK